MRERKRIRTTKTTAVTQVRVERICPILHNGTVTSRAAAVAIQAVSPTGRARILEALKKSGPNGMTREEISIVLNIPIQTVTARVSELICLRKAKEWGPKRPTIAGVQAFVVSAIF